MFLSPIALGRIVLTCQRMPWYQNGMANRPIPCGDTRSLRRRVEQSGRTLADFCRFAALEPSLFHKWRRGEVKPRAETWGRLLDALDRFERRAAA